MMTSRRGFLQMIPGAGAALVAPYAGAQSPPPLLNEKDPQAVALGYVADAKRVDKAKYPKFVAGEHCAICQFYQGAKTAPTAPCTIFAGKGVHGPGWCSAYVVKPNA